MKEKFKPLMPYLLLIFIVFSLYQRSVVLRLRKEVHQSVQFNLAEFVKEVRNAPYDETTYASLYSNITTAGQLYRAYSLSGAKSLKERDTLLLGLITEIKYLLRNNRKAIENTFTPGSEATILLINVTDNLTDKDSIKKLIGILEAKYY